MSETANVRLTQFSKGSGCGCKIAPAVLEEILKTSSEKFTDTNLLIGYESKDDAAVYDMGDGNCIISTTDFFTPIVDDAYDFGRIAAANAISDVYAMGGKPLMALAILGWPVEKIPVALAKQVLEGARSICKEAGIVLAGGHSIDISEPVFGLAVTGTVKKNHIKKNNGIKEGDSIFITKPLGSGVLAAALKRNLLKEEHKNKLIQHLVSLNSIGEKLGAAEHVHAVTDVTGFGLLGHLLEMSEGTGLSIEIEKKSIPVLNGFNEYAAQFIYPENTTRNFTAFADKSKGMTDLDFLLMCDPQTNGGLLVASSNEADFLTICLQNGGKPIRLGRVVSFDEKQVIFS